MNLMFGFLGFTIECVIPKVTGNPRDVFLELPYSTGLIADKKKENCFIGRNTNNYSRFYEAPTKLVRS